MSCLEASDTDCGGLVASNSPFSNVSHACGVTPDRKGGSVRSAQGNSQRPRFELGDVAPGCVLAVQYAMREVTHGDRASRQEAQGPSMYWAGRQTADVGALSGTNGVLKDAMLAPTDPECPLGLKLAGLPMVAQRALPGLAGPSPTCTELANVTQPSPSGRWAGAVADAGDTAAV